MSSSDFEATLDVVTAFLTNRNRDLDQQPTRPTRAALDAALQALPASLPEQGLGTRKAVEHILRDVVPGLWTGHAGNRYFGLVTGGVTEGAQLGDMIATSLDESLQVNFPDSTIGLALEDKTCDLVLDLLGIPTMTFKGRTITTGATASNIVGLACARDKALLGHPWLSDKGWNVAEDGFPPAATEVEEGDLSYLPSIQVFCRKPHGSINKAAAVLGIGRRNVVEVPSGSDAMGIGMNAEALDRKLAERKISGVGCIVVLTLGEVNTGFFAQNVHQIADICDQHSAWLHIDAAFGAFAALLPENKHLGAEMARADSLTVDAHKWLNSPYDCGLLFTRDSHDLVRSFGPSPKSAGPAYLAPSNIDDLDPVADDVRALRDHHQSLPSPLNCGIENSRRNRALPLFTALMENGRDGYAGESCDPEGIRVLEADSRTSLKQTSFDGIVNSPIASLDGCKTLKLEGRWYELINANPSSAEKAVPLNIVLFRSKKGSKIPPRDAGRLVKAINETRRIFVTITSWNETGAVRIAVSNWRTARGDDGVEASPELAEVKRVLTAVMQE